MKVKNIKEIHIDGRRWFQKSYGNTYNTTKTLVVFNDGSTEEFTTSMKYGYGDHYKDVAVNNLVKNNILPKLKGDRSYYWSDFKDLKINMYYSAIDCLKRDLH